jgi:tetratricopeptide (TPR) repeat protein
VLFSENLSTEAMSFFIRSLELDGSHNDAAQNLLDVMAARGKVSRDDAEALAGRFPENPVFRRFLAGMAAPGKSAAASAPALPAWRAEVESLIQSGKYAPAIDRLEERMLRGEEPAACRNYLGIIAHACGDAETALQHFRAARDLNPQDADTLFNLSDTLLAVGRGDEAARLLEDSVRAGVESDANLPDLAATAEQIRHALSRGRVDAAALLASRDANQTAERLLRTGDLEEAVRYLQAAIEADPDDFRAYNNLGLASWYAGNGDAAWNFFVLALEIRPAWTDPLVNAFDTALKLSDAESAGVLIDNALAANPNHAQALAMRRHLKSQGQAANMFGSFEALEANAKRLAEAERLMEQGKQGEAIAVFLDAVAEHPENPQAFNGLGIIAFAEKRYEDAFGLFGMAASLHPLDQDILLNHWQCAQALGREAEVLPRLRQQVEKNPALADVKAALKAYA